MAVDEKFLQHVEGQLAEFPGFKVKKMFGGVGFFRDDAMFGLIKNQMFMLRTDPQDLGPYAGQPQFGVEMRGELKTMPYHAVPESVLANPRHLAQWAEIAAALAVVAKAKKK
jgi:DNA transformation protein and related proteins